MARRAVAGAFSRRGRGGGSARRHRAVSLRHHRHLQDVRVRERRYRPQGNRHRCLALSAAGRLRERAGHTGRRRGTRTPRLPRRRAPCRALAGSRVRRVQGPLERLRPARSRRQLPRLDGLGPPAQRRGRNRPPLVGRGRHRGLPPAGARAGRAPRAHPAPLTTGSRRAASARARRPRWRPRAWSRRARSRSPHRRAAPRSGASPAGSRARSPTARRRDAACR